jgi:AcrR family transcriptional regulator
MEVPPTEPTSSPANRASPPRRGQLRPGGRTELVRRAVAGAVLESLKRGDANFSVGDVAARAGVHRSTVHRRWPERADLVREALTLHTVRIEIPDTVSWDDDILALARNLADFVSNPLETAIDVATLASSDREVGYWISGYWTPPMRELARPVERAIERGEIPEDTDPTFLVTMLLGPILLRCRLTGRRPDPEFVQDVAQAVIRLARRD